MESKIKIAIFTIAVIVVTVCAVLLIANYNYSRTANQQGDTTPTTAVQETAKLEILNKNGKSLGKYDLKFTSGATLTEAMQKLANDDKSFTFQATSSQYGNFLNTVNGVTANSASEFWNIKVNGADSDLGMDSLKIKDGDVIQIDLANF